ncbi:hypothetical protein E3N88_19704 [Mikania micrantha]|uniref:Transmembrane protein n=1 Tax=Mikania micrantha TaxID=192012 RepID=A0A5N6NRR2_9ASTR|nr:hypothetical protein E3N88_19704 [Mikania micrantha]
MGSEIAPLEIEEAESSPTQAAITFPISIIWWKIPILLFVLYVITARLALNTGDLKVADRIHNKEVNITTHDTTVILSATLNMYSSVRKTSKIHPVSEMVSYHLTATSLIGVRKTCKIHSVSNNGELPSHRSESCRGNALVSTFSFSPFDISKNEMNVRSPAKGQREYVEPHNIHHLT